MKCSLIFSFLSFLFISFSSANIIYVKEGALGNGTSWENATGDLNEALQTADYSTQIWVAEGTYYPIDCNPCNDNLRNISFEIRDGVQLYGGFVGNETRLGQRKPRTNATILSGNIGRDDLFDNSFTVVSMRHVSSKTILDGFIISDGNADNISKHGNPLGTGAGIYNDGSDGRSNPVIRDCIFMYNQAVQGAAIFNNAANGEASPTFKKCSFVSNRATKGGGAIFNFGQAGIVNMSAIGCQFVGNEAELGGGIFSVMTQNGTGNIVFDACKFVTNKALFGGALFYLGKQSQAHPVLEACSFLNNKAQEGPDWFTEKGEKIPEHMKGRLANHYTQNL